MASIGVTGRGGPTNPDPLRHVWTPRKASRTGVCHQALCGQGGIRPGPRYDLGEFDPAHPRSCRDCVAALEQRIADIDRRYRALDR